MIRTPREIAFGIVEPKGIRQRADRSTRPIPNVVRYASLLSIAIACTTACSDDFGDNNAESGGTAGSSDTSVGGKTNKGGSSNKGGSVNKGGSGGKSTGGSKAVGGSSAVTSGGAGSLGGATAAGGTGTTSTVVTGGTTSVGGTTATVGGTSSSGGTTAAAGGTSSTGGTTAAVGGTSSTGGTTAAAGGTSSTGGTTAAAGGTSSTGGTTADSGGTSSVGGTTADSGGTSSAGGTTSTGGTTNVPTPKALLRYDFDDVSATVATDATSSHNDGTLASSVTLDASGRNTAAASFASADAAIAMPTGLSFGTDTITISAWVKLTSSDSGSRLFTLETANDNYLYLTINDGGTPAGISLHWSVPSGTDQVLTTQTQLPVGVWKHITVVTSATLSQIYVDGKIVAQGTSGMTPAALGSISTSVVGNSGDNTDGIRGLVDEFQLYDGSLTESEIHTLAWPKTDYSMYHFDEGTGTVATDSSTRAKHGTLNGAASWVTGAFGGALKLDNASTGDATQYVDLGTGGMLAACTTNLTVAAWIMLETNNSNADFFYTGEVPADSTIKYSYMRFGTAYTSGTASSEMFIGYFYDAVGTSAGTMRYARNANTWTTGTWTHIAYVRRKSGTWEGSGIDLYVNGVRIGGADLSPFNTGRHPGGWTILTTKNYFGRSGANDSVRPGFDGTIDEVLISCRNYTADEIKHLAYKP